MEFAHIPVLYEEVLSGLAIRPDGIYIDGTLGGAGHASGVAARLTTGRLIGLDQDTEALHAAESRLLPYKDRVTVVHSNYEHMIPVVHALGVQKVQGILLDLGVSSYQLDNPGRGFSYMDEDAPLDMRMDQTAGQTAADFLNTASEETIRQVLWDYGEERYAAAIAMRIVRFRAERPLATAGDLNEIIRQAIPVKKRERNHHPSRRTFQAVRIAVNRELSVLEDHITEMIDLLDDGGRFCIITFHSLEDRIVKKAFKTAQDPCICPPQFPVCTCGRVSKGVVITKKPILPSEEEAAQNPRSQSAKLRIFERRISPDEAPKIDITAAARRR